MSNQDHREIKSDLQNKIERLITILRQVLSCIHEERSAISRHEWPALESVLAKREELILASQPLIQKFTVSVNALSSESVEDFSLFDGLNKLRVILPPEDIDLHLYVSQLSVIATEIRQQTRSLLAALENQSASSFQAQKFLVKLDAKPVKTGLLLAETDEPVDQ